MQVLKELQMMAGKISISENSDMKRDLNARLKTFQLRSLDLIIFDGNFSILHISAISKKEQKFEGSNS